MKKQYMIWVFIFSVVITMALATNMTIDCDWYDATCPSGSSGYLRMNNASANFTNGHAQLMNASGTNYTSIMCCNSSPSDRLIPTGKTVIPFINLYSEDNSHIEEPGQSNYNYTAEFKTSASYASCAWTNTSCADGFNCIYSLDSDTAGDKTNAHISACGVYTAQVCCMLVDNSTVGGTYSPGGPGGPVAYSIFDSGSIENFLGCADGEIVVDGECASELDTTCSWGFDKNVYEVNETITFTFYCPDHVGRVWSAEVFTNEAVVARDYYGPIKQANRIEFVESEPFEGVLVLNIDEHILIASPYRVRGSFDILAAIAEVKWMIMFGVFIIMLSLLLFKVYKNINKKKRIR